MKIRILLRNRAGLSPRIVAYWFLRSGVATPPKGDMARSHLMLMIVPDFHLCWWSNSGAAAVRERRVVRLEGAVQALQHGVVSNGKLRVCIGPILDNPIRLGLKMADFQLSQCYSTLLQAISKRAIDTAQFNWQACRARTCRGLPALRGTCCTSGCSCRCSRRGPCTPRRTEQRARRSCRQGKLNEIHFIIGES